MVVHFDNKFESIDCAIVIMDDNSAAAMIRRFREGKPTSRVEREKQKQEAGVSKLWYEQDAEVPRRSLTVEPVLQPPRPNSALRSIRQSDDFMSDKGIYRNSKLGDSIAVDDLIEKEIRQLEREMHDLDRSTNAKLDLGSFHHSPSRSFDMHGSFDNTRNSTNYRFGGLRSSSRGGDMSPLRMSGDILRTSVETLGTTGFRGLLTANLKLDGKKDEPKEEEKPPETDLAELNKKLQEFLASMAADHPPRNPYFPEGVDETIAQIANKVTNDIMEFQTLFGDKHLREDQQEATQKERDEQMREEGRNQARERQLLDLDLPSTHPLEYFGVWDGQRQYPGIVEPSAVPYLQHPSAQPVTTQLGHNDLSILRVSDESSVGGSPFPQYKSSFLSPQPSSQLHDREGFGVGGPTALEGLAGGAEESKGESGARPAGAAPTLREAGVLSAGGGAPHRHAVQGFGQAAGMVQAAVDIEMSAADEVFAKMRSLRSQLGDRMRHLDALHSSVNPAPHPSQQHPPLQQVGGRLGIPLYARPGGPPPAPMHLARPGAPRPQYVPHMAQGVHFPYPRAHPYQQPHSAVPPQYWGLEEYYAAQEAERQAALGNPLGLDHMGVYGVAEGIHSVLDGTMAELQSKLPAPAPTPTPAAVPEPSPSLEEATVTAAKAVFPDTPPTQNPSASAVEQVAASVVKGVLDMREYEVKADGSVAHVSAVLAAPPVPAASASSTTTATKAAPTPATTQSARQLLSEMDRVLGADEPKTNYLARDLLAPSLTPAPPSLRTADQYLQSQYGSTPSDPQSHSDALRRRQHPDYGTPVYIRAPSDRELAQRYPMEHSGPSVPTAPPSALDSASRLSAPPSQPHVAFAPTQHDLYPPIAGPIYHTVNASNTTTADSRTLVQNANPFPLRRPAEGSAIEYMRTNNICVADTATGRKYVNPFVQAAPVLYSSPSRSGRNPHYVPPENGKYVPSPMQQQPRFIPSPTSVVAVHEKESYLRQMRQLRQQMMST